MTTFSIAFLGCKVSHTDAQEIRERLVADGHEEADAGDDRGRELVLRDARGGAEVPPGRAPRGTQRATRLRDRVRREPRRQRLRRSSPERHGRPAPERADAGVRVGRRRRHRVHPAEVGLDRVRAFVKVQDGCSFSCAFCVIPQVRGATRSRNADAVLAEIRRRVAQGHREVVLTGINLGCYRDRGAGFDLPRLIREAGATPGLARLRLSSIEVNHVSDALLAAMRRDAERVAASARAAPVR